MEFRILGPLEVRADDGSPLQIPQSRQRAMLSVLLLHANEPLTTEMLMDALWGPELPRAAAGALRTYVWAVRRLLAPSARLHTRSSGYMFEVEEGELDLEIFDHLVVEARLSLGREDADAASDQLQRALGLWRNPPFADVPTTPAIAGEVELLRAQRDVAQELLNGIELRLGRHQQLVPRLRKLVSEDPSQEQYWGQLMLALYRGARQADALAAYGQARAVLSEEFGIEPGAELRRLHQQVLAAASELDLASGAVPGVRITNGASTTAQRPSQIPPAPMDFVGRTAEFAEIVTALTPPEPVTGVPVVAVCGPPGVGKSSLASLVAHALRDRFPDGQLFTELEAPSGRPRCPGEALEEMLRSLGVPTDCLPASVAERAALLRSRLAGQRMLVVIDDAAGRDQVIPLLPGTAGCAVLVTSRTRLVGLPGVRSTSLQTLTTQESLMLLANIIGIPRVEAERGEAIRLVAACGRLPLAIRIAGARLQSRPRWPLRRFADPMADQRRRLDELAVDGLSVRGAMASTYTALDERGQRLFRLLSLADQPDIPEWVITALHGRPDTREALDGLLDRYVLESGSVDSSGHPRYQMDSLMADYARERLRERPAREREAALERLAGQISVRLRLHTGRPRRHDEAGRRSGITADEATVATQRGHL
jgi:DNA-binding SARP family transcriptional activator